MRKAMKDKLFFLDFIPEVRSTFVDFGCADGSLITALYESRKGSDIAYIGYDLSSEMINLAKKKFNYSTDRVIFTTNWNSVVEKLNACVNTKKILILSSVIHEVYSYGSEEDIKEFWERVLNSGFDYICIRDMMYSQDMDRDADSKLFFNVSTWKYKNMISEFMEKWGLLANNLSLIHFLLKYRWQINWERELNENYFPIEVTEFLDKFEEKYNTTYLERFRVPFLEECWNKDFGIRINEYTHIKAIFERKK
jgi:ubiquinone/menaquinone biosynthesis C-methylase UbiE